MEVCVGRDAELSREQEVLPKWSVFHTTVPSMTCNIKTTFSMKLFYTAFHNVFT